MSIDTSAVREECEERKEREKAVWRASCEREWDRARGREVEATSFFSTYTEVVAVSGRGRGGMGAVGEGHQVSALQWRGGSEVSAFCVVPVVDLIYYSPRVLTMTCH